MRNSKKIFLLLFGFLILHSCKSDDDAIPAVDLVVLDFYFADDQNTPLDEGACIDPSREYNIAIIVDAEEGREFVTTQIEYTLNGNLQSVTFTNPGVKQIRMDLVLGVNTLQIASTGLSKQLEVIELPEFELVP